MSSTTPATSKQGRPRAVRSRVDGLDAGAGGADEREETPAERLDRNLDELTSELRVVITGIQVLFAFLLIVPFNQGFRNVGSFERGVYFATLVLAAAATVCTMAPAVEHRLVFRQADKRHLVFHANRIVIAGMVFMALAMCGALLLVSSKLFGPGVGAVVAAVAAASFGVLWFGLPLSRRLRVSDQDDARERRPGAPGG
jgi:hypothetical protein